MCEAVDGATTVAACVCWGGRERDVLKMLIFSHAHTFGCDDDPTPWFPMGHEDYVRYDMTDFCTSTISACGDMHSAAH